MTLWKIDRATEKIAWQVFLQSSSFTISSIFIHFPTISSTLRTHKSSSNANIDPTPKKILMHFTCSWPMGKLPFEELDYWQRWRNNVSALSSQSKSPFFHSKNQILQPDIPHIYASPKTIQFHHTLNAPEVQRKDLKPESKTIETASCRWTS